MRIASELALPELHPGQGPADVSITCSWIHDEAERPDGLKGSGRHLQISLDGIGFTISDGERIDIEAPAATDPADIRVYLLGSIVAALLNQRGILTIHANVVRSGSGAAAFAGASGAGKSTLASWFDAKGYDVLCDDLCAFALTDEGAKVFPGIPRTKLWLDTLHAFNRSPEGLSKVASDIDKFHVPLRSASGSGPLGGVPLERIYILDRSRDGDGVSVERLKGIAAAEAVLANAFRWHLGQRVLDSPREQFDQYLALARQVAVLRVHRPWSLQNFEEGALEIERHLRAPLPQQAD